MVPELPKRGSGSPGDQTALRCVSERHAVDPVTTFRILPVVRISQGVQQFLAGEGRTGLEAGAPARRRPGDDAAHVDPPPVDQGKEDRNQLSRRRRCEGFVQITADAREDVDLKGVEHECALGGGKVFWSVHTGIVARLMPVATGPSIDGGDRHRQGRCMDSTLASLGCRTAWSKLLENYRPRPTDDQQGPPSLGCLIEAAGRNATLGAMYPWVSMQQLSVSTENRWEEWGHASLPAMFARPDGYAVVGHDRRGEIVRLTTPDPGKAAAFAAGLMRTDDAVRPEGPRAWSSEVERVLREAGWHPGRAVDTTGWKQQLEQDGFRSHAAAEDFLGEFGELVIGHGGAGITRAREPVDLDSLLALGEADRFDEWGEEIGHHLFPVGELAGRFLGLGEDGELYVVANWLARFGRMPEAMENLVLGVMPVHMPEPE